MALFQEFQFTNADLDAEYLKVFTHNKNTEKIDLEWWDDEGIKQTTAGVFEILNTGSFRIAVGGPINGTHTVKMFYDNNTQLQGTRLFADLPIADDFNEPTYPIDTYNVAFGNETSSLNVNLEDFIKKCQAPTSGITPLIASNNLSDVTSIPVARANLSVYSKQETVNLNIPDEFTYTLPTIDWDVQVLNVTFNGVKPNIVNTVYGVMNSSFIVTPTTGMTSGNTWVYIFKNDASARPKQTHTFVGISKTGKHALCRVLGKTYYDETTATFLTTPISDIGKVEVFLIGQYNEPYYFHYSYTVGDYDL
jgi:hypothetical protein